MSLDYSEVWKKMNELEMVTSKICSAREILDSAIDALENHNKSKAETLMYAVDEFLQYYLEDFDRKFKDAWNETVSKVRQEEYSYLMNDFLTQDRISNFPGEQYTDEEMEAMCDHAEQQEKDKVIKWQLPVEMDGVSGEYFITFPDDLLDAIGLKEGDSVEWIDQNNGSFILKKIDD